MKLVKVSDNKIVDAESGHVWCYFPPDDEDPMSSVRCYTVREDLCFIEADEADTMWAWLLRHLAN